MLMEMALLKKRKNQEPYIPIPSFSLANSIGICDGNSLTFGLGAGVVNSYPYQMRDLPPFNTNGATIYNLGVSSQQTQAMIDNFNTNVLSKKSETYDNIIVGWEIGNDLYINGDMEGAKARWMQYCALGVSNGFIVLSINLTPRNHSGAYDTIEDYNNALLEANAWLTSEHRKFCHGLVDIASDSRLQDFNNTTYFADGVHFTTPGYAIVAEAVKNKLLELI